MTFEVSLEAIEADLIRAESGGTPGAVAVHLARAQVRATLLASGHRVPLPDGVTIADVNRLASLEPSQTQEQLGQGVTDIVVSRSPLRDVFTVPADSPWADRVEAAAMLLDVSHEWLLARVTDPQPVLEPPAEPHLEMDIDDDEPEDVFAEARKARRK